ncbi:MAG: TAXI family TRAP transporter solute-binding subunit [Bacillota bacterium]|nr:TAXI family TRAP transporter solute-binding subunit [Bacillota bacterium]
MKKKFSIVLILLLTVALIAAGCGGNDQPQPSGENNANEEKQEDVVQATRLLMATGGTGGTYYPLGGSMANVWNNHIEGLNVTIEATGASVENIRLLASGETDLAMAMNGPAMNAYLGTGDFEGNPVEFSAVGVIYPEVMQIIAPQSTGIQDVADLKGKRVSIGPAGSGTASAAINILAAYGMDPDNDIVKFQDNFADAARKIKDGQLDAAFAVLAVPAGNVIDITTSTPVNIVNIQGEGLDKLLELDPTFTAYEIPAGTYDGQDVIGYTVSQWAVLYVPNDMDETLVYNLTKNMYEKVTEIARGHDMGNQITIDNAMKGIDPVPFHPGAEKYYKEQGLIN